jgi:hypothetical protein
MAQNAKALAVIIADNKKMCGEEGCPVCGSTCSESPTCSCGLPLMSDDHKGLVDITIPSFIISQRDGNLIKSCFQGKTCTGSDTTIVASLSWDLPATDGTVEWQMWSSSWDTGAVRFKKEFENVAIALGSSAKFTPHYFVFDGVEWGCNTADHLCGSQCIGNGLYCAADPNSKLDDGLEGFHVVEENLRQICIWNVAKKTFDKDAGAKYWRYINLFQETCATPTSGVGSFDEKCSKKVQDSVGIDSNLVTACILESTDVEGGHDANSLLQGELTSRENLAILSLPSLVVNGVIIRGNAYSSSILTTICNAYIDGSEPAACNCAGLELESLQTCVASVAKGGQGIVAPDSSSGLALGPMGVFLLVAIISVILLVGGVLTLKYIRNETAKQVQSTLVGYRPLDDFDKSLLEK